MSGTFGAFKYDRESRAPWPRKKSLRMSPVGRSGAMQREMGLPALGGSRERMRDVYFGVAKHSPCVVAFCCGKWYGLGLANASFWTAQLSFWRHWGCKGGVPFLPLTWRSTGGLFQDEHGICQMLSLRCLFAGGCSHPFLACWFPCPLV